MKTHPEQGPREVYLGNHRGEVPAHLRSLQTLRFGGAVYDIDGCRLTGADAEGLRPMFVGNGEHDAYDRIMEARLSRIRRGLPL
jgi:hypothetical protein